ncbi:DNA cytosine methyltransferase [Pseudomonas aeruginosa]|uniref:DNA cytosine methyltransferase n=1 Tax=Pseudomonas aeruginosa TaxID=287 RepID=UPI000F53F7FD|nr:DNA cytosine methyltransferase [Pseudomonas aeruginosa]RQJ32040.1 cytosine methyltransferase [Pseudomonas aeruginosa]
MNHHQELDFCTMCSGIEAPSVALESIGFRARWFAEIEPFPSAVLAHHYPSVPNHGDMTKLIRRILTEAIEAPPLAIAGTPCQAFSVAGWREGLTDPRGALTIKFVETIDAIDLVRTRRREPECIAWWENVPGVLSDKENAFGCFLAALVGESEELQPPGGKWKDAGCVYGPKRTAAWRVLDAQYFGLAQRRRRVFVIASARAGFDPCEVLFEREGLRRDSPPSRGQGKEVTCSTAGRPGSFGPDSRWAEDWGSTAKAFGGGKNCNPTDVSTAITAHPGGRYDLDAETFVVADIPTVAATLTAQYGKSGGIPAGNDCVPVNLIAGTLQANGKAAGSATQQDAESGLLVVHGTQDPDVVQDCAHTLGRNHGQENAVFDPNQITSATNRSQPTPGLCHTLPASSQAPIAFPLLEVGKRTGRSTFDPRAGLGVGAENDPMFKLQASAQHGVCVTGDITHTLKTEGFDASEDGTGRGQPITPEAAGVRRLTPRECERLQGFPDDYTLIPWRGKPATECPDGPRYKAIGNSKAVPVVRWIGRRLKAHLEKLS